MKNLIFQFQKSRWNIFWKIHILQERNISIYKKQNGLVWLAGWFGAFVYFPAEKMKKLCRGGDRIIFPNNKKKLQCWLFSGQIEICTFFFIFFKPKIKKVKVSIYSWANADFSSTTTWSSYVVQDLSWVDYRLRWPLGFEVYKKWKSIINTNDVSNPGSKNSIFTFGLLT